MRTIALENLWPAGEWRPPSNCSVPIDAVGVYAGGAVSWTRKFPYTAVSADEKDLVILDKDSAGNLIVDATVFDDRRNLIAKLEKE